MPEYTPNISKTLHVDGVKVLRSYCGVCLWSGVMGVRFWSHFSSHALGCVNQFIMSRAPSLMNNIDRFIEVSYCVALVKFGLSR